MAKKKGATKPKKKAKKKAVTKPKPKAQRLPGMDIPKVRSLDRLCERMADVRETLNEAKRLEKEISQKALAELQAHKIGEYRAHGIELYRVSGDEKIRVRVVDSDEGGEAEAPELAPEDDETAQETTEGAGPRLVASGE